MTDWFKPAGSTGDGDYQVVIRPGHPDWQYSGLLVADLAAGQSRTVETGDCEWIVLPLRGFGLTVCSEEHSVTLAGRADVFSGATDSAYIGRDSSFTVTASGPTRVALAHATARAVFPFAHVLATDVPVELRGAGSCSRQVQNFGTPGVLKADSIIACEVITPAGNWSSYPPHKHDEEREGIETSLEEIYYFELRTEPALPAATEPTCARRDGPVASRSGGQSPAFAYHRVYGTATRPIEVLVEVRSGDTVLVPHGWHGPAMAPPGYDLYYLNVMAGPGQQRAWLICDDPAHAWVRETWQSQQVDSRLPFPLR